MSFGGRTPSYRLLLLDSRQLRALELLIPVVIVSTVIHGFHCDLDFSIRRHHPGKY